MTNVDARMVYKNAHELLNKSFPGLQGRDIAEVCKLTQNTYRFEQPLVAGATMYQFPVLVNQQVFSNTETRLNQQDSAVIYSLGVFAGQPASATDSAWVPSSYNAPFIFGANAAALYSLWNGSNLTITVNNDVLVPNWDIFKHYNAPETQATAAPGAGSPEDQLRGGWDGFYPVEPNIIFVGSKNNVVTINLSQGVAAVNTYSRIVVIARAITAQNSTVVS